MEQYTHVLAVAVALAAALVPEAAALAVAVAEQVTPAALSSQSALAPSLCSRISLFCDMLTRQACLELAVY